MPVFTFAIPGDITTLTGGYIYDRRVIGKLRQSGLSVDHCELPASFPNPSEADIAASIIQLNATSADGPVIIDGLAFGAIPHEAAKHVRGGLIALCHHPLALEAGLESERAAWLRANERANLALADRVIVVSATTAQMVRDEFAVADEKIRIAEPGVDPMPRSSGGRSDNVELLCVGSLIERKGYDVLLEALQPLRHLPWRLRIAGSPTRAPEIAARLERLRKDLQLSGQVELLGEVNQAELASLYVSSDIFVLPSRYEGYGMVLAEAMASGLPVITSTGGAAATTVPDAAAIKVPADDVAELQRALEQLLCDAGQREQLGEASWRAGQRLPRWQATAAIFASTVSEIAQETSR